MRNFMSTSTSVIHRSGWNPQRLKRSACSSSRILKGKRLMSRNLFGTDGIRGVAGEFPLDRKTANAVGYALGQWILRSGNPREVVIGMDTRESGPWLAAEVAGGLAAGGVEAKFAGVTTTPGVAYLAKTGPFAAGVMISASHNPYQDNGIKILGHSGYKLPDAEEEQLEGGIFERIQSGAVSPSAELPVDEGLDRAYIDHLASIMPAKVSGFRMVIDSANGSASHLAPELFQRVGANVYSIGNAPTGRNINLNCGSLHLEQLQAVVLERGADLGVAFDRSEEHTSELQSRRDLV